MVVNEYGWDQTQLAAAFQDGLLIATAPAEEIKAAYGGTVTNLTEADGDYTIEISHANGLVTIYGKCAQCYVQLNEPVEKGQAIGTTQQTEQEDGNFYFAARYLGEPINPLELLKEKEAAHNNRILLCIKEAKSYGLAFSLPWDTAFSVRFAVVRKIIVNLRKKYLAIFGRNRYNIDSKYLPKMKINLE